MTILDQAATLTSEDRHKTYGHPSENFDTISRLWDAYLDQRQESWKRVYGERLFEIMPADVAAMMILTKVARLANTPTHKDSLVDIAGYARTWEMLEDE